MPLLVFFVCGVDVVCGGWLGTKKGTITGIQWVVCVMEFNDLAWVGLVDSSGRKRKQSREQASSERLQIL